MQGHSKRVSELAVRLAKLMGLEGEDLEQLRRGALLHDVGKIAIPDSILLKEDKLTAAERRKINLHPIYGKEFMEHIEFLEPALDIPYSHHKMGRERLSAKTQKKKNPTSSKNIFSCGRLGRDYLR